MTTAACVGGVLATGRFVRLLTNNGYNQNSDTRLNVGDVYTIVFSEQNNKIPPHIEDILVSSMAFKFSFSSISKMIAYLKNKLNVKIWSGGPEMLFDGKLQWTHAGSGFISENGEIPENSVGFWQTDRPLNKNISYNKVRYHYAGQNITVNIPFVGFDDPVECLPANSLLRVSLARWWDRNGETEKRCYLQLSGWYATDSEEDDLPF